MEFSRTSTRQERSRAGKGSRNPYTGLLEFVAKCKSHINKVSFVMLEKNQMRIFKIKDSQVLQRASRHIEFLVARLESLFSALGASGPNSIRFFSSMKL